MMLLGLTLSFNYYVKQGHGQNVWHISWSFDAEDFLFCICNLLDINNLDPLSPTTSLLA